MLYENSQNDIPFSEICGNKYGRKIITTYQTRIDESNIVEELNKALPIHERNAREINYLDNYYRGDQPILYRVKKGNRDDVNNKIVENLAYMVVETKTAEMVGEPIQYNLRGADEVKSEQVAELNRTMEGEDKSFFDITLDRWRHICGTAYRFIGDDEDRNPLMDEAGFCLHTEDPRYTFVAYYSDGVPAFSCQIRKDSEERITYNCFTAYKGFVIYDGEIKKTTVNGNYAVPVIEYPNNERRLSDIEITISMTDEINKMAADRSNGIEQFVSSWIKFVNCEIDEKTFKQMKLSGALAVKSNNNSTHNADVDILSNELNQSESQIAVDDTYNKLLVIQGIANREGNTGGDTGQAVTMRNGWYQQEQRAEICEPIFKRSERMALRIILNRLRIRKGFKLMPSDIEIKIPRSKADNMQSKAQTLQMLLASGINPSRAIKTCALFSDPEQVATESAERMAVLYPTEIQQPVVVEEVEEKVTDNGNNSDGRDKQPT